MPKKISEQTKDRAVRLVLEQLDEYDNMTAACESVAKVSAGISTHIGPECVRTSRAKPQRRLSPRRRER